MTVTRYKPEAVITFYTETGDLVARNVKDPKSNEDSDFVSITTLRDMNTDSPTFTINLTRKKMWHKWITSNDLVKIEMHRPPQIKQTVFVGLVDDVRKNVVLSDDGVQRVITITGRGIAKAFIENDIGVVPEAEYASTTVGWLQSVGVNLAGSSMSQILKATWDIVAKKMVNYRWENHKELFDIIGYSFTDRPNMVLLDDSSIINYEGSLYSFLKEIAEPPFYELFFKIVANVPMLVARPTPFNPEEWNKLKAHKITDDDVVNEEIGRSDVETYTLYSVGAKTLFSPNDTYKTFGQRPFWYKPYADKYGIKRLHVESAYMSVAQDTDASLVDIMRELMADLYNWNIRNNSFYNGKIVVVGKSEYQIGERLLYHSDEDQSIREFYITSVRHTFTNYGKWVTELGVTRGCHPNERFLPPVGMYTEYSGIGLIEFNPEKAREALMAGSDQSNPLDTSDQVTANDVVAGAYEVMNNGINGHKVRYVFGGNSPKTGSLDCSSFTQYVYKTYAGLDIGRVTGQQVQKGTKVSKDKLEPGDLVFFKNTYNSSHIYGVSHVGIYVGDGKFINNSSGGGGVQIDKLSNSYWTAHWLMGRRVLSKKTTSPSKSTGKGTNYTATAYGASKENLGVPDWWVPTYKTATGTTPTEGRTIAVDPDVIPLHSKVYIESDFPGITGEYIAEDTGGAIKGKRIDIYFNDIPPKYSPSAARKRMLKFGKRTVKVTILRRGK
ncbi:hypothetical protein Goe19_00860 [Bacillus phage vB_BsuM-Goe19]|nr:hypothetical protein Goe19_00860 [Bacillus phage vB_BsuM-Goe19]